jgi:hypothetical protein
MTPLKPRRISHPTFLRFQDMQSAPVSNAHHECRHTVTSAGLLKTAVCTEWHEFTPFTDRQTEGGAIRSTTRMRIVFVSEKKEGEWDHSRANLMNMRI